MITATATANTDTDTTPATVLVLRTSRADGTSHNGFVWPESGPVTCCSPTTLSWRRR